MGFKKDSTAFNVFELTKGLPYFSINHLAALEIDRNGLKILLHRLAKRGKIIPLKKGLYVCRLYVDNLQKKGTYNKYLEFIGGVLSGPSYLSLEYVLSEHNILTELTWGFTFATRLKTNRFVNELGSYTYRRLSPRLFCGFKTIKAGEFAICKATPAKALFDFLYLRKNSLTSPESIEELRLNTDMLKATDRKEFGRYISLEGSSKMKMIADAIFKEEK